MLQTISIAAGGAVGALLRFWTSNGVHILLGRSFPFGTLSVNIIGSLAMGLLYVLFLERMTVEPEVRAALLVGFLGAFTTFSTFSIETLNLVEQAEYVKALTNIVVSVLGCVFAAWIGMKIGRQI
ncbi:MAG: fluoride efflux transporter CrcB [Gammaproteobacteria bacterium]